MPFNQPSNLNKKFWDLVESSSINEYLNSTKHSKPEPIDYKQSKYNKLGLDELSKVNKAITQVQIKDYESFTIEKTNKENLNNPKSTKADDSWIYNKELLSQEPPKKIMINNPIQAKLASIINSPSKIIQNSHIKPINQSSIKSVQSDSRSSVSHRSTFIITSPIPQNSPFVAYSDKRKNIFYNNFSNLFKELKGNQSTFKEGESSFSEQLHFELSDQRNNSTNPSEKKNPSNCTNQNLSNKISCAENLKFTTFNHQKSMIDTEFIVNDDSTKVVFVDQSSTPDVLHVEKCYKSDLDKNLDTLTLSSCATSINLIIPGKTTKEIPKLKIVHIEYNFNEIFLIIKIQNNIKDWLVRKNLLSLSFLIKENEKISYNPTRNKIYREIIEINLNSKLVKNITLLQSFILTDIVNSFELKNDFLLHFNTLRNNWEIVKLVKERGLKMKGINFEEAVNVDRIELVNNNVFRVYGKNVWTYGCNSKEEVDLWIKWMHE